MAEFKFTVDEKCIYWERSSVSVEAGSYEDAVKKIKGMSSREIRELIADTGNGSEILYETYESMEPKDNGGYPTIEVYSKDGTQNMIASPNE